MPRERRLPPPPPLPLDSALFLDIDGTLAELADDPSSVHIDDAIARLLPTLAERLGGALALVTGRSISDVDRLVGGLPIAGQHGVERRGADGAIHLHAPSPAVIARMRELLSTLAAQHPALRLEDKGVTLALHYRRAPALASYVHRALRRSMGSPSVADGYVLQPGKMLMEVRPGARDKGTAIRDFLGESPFAGRRPVFVGDDRTDEHGFALVTAHGGWAVKVGRGPTCAHYRLRDVAAVSRWLRAAAAATPRSAASPSQTCARSISR